MVSVCRAVLCAVLALLAVTPLARAADVAGTVTDAAGKPAGNVEVARTWLWGVAVRGAFSNYGSATSDASGAFRLELPEWSYPAPVFALDAERRLGAVAVVSRGQKTLSLRLRPLVPVRYRLRVPDGDTAAVPFWNLTVSPEGTAGGYCLSLVSAASGQFLLPPGEYTFRASSGETVSAARRFRVEAGSVDLGEVSLPLGPLAKRYGKAAAPLTVTDAKGASAGIRLADLRGKWVLIDFWGYWCPPCVQKSLPDAMRFWDEHAADRDRFAILTFHCLGDADTVAKLQPSLSALERDVWKRTLPFPVLLDATGKTVRDWGVTLYPTTVLIDPEGNVVRGGSLEVLGERLRAKSPGPAAAR